MQVLKNTFYLTLLFKNIQKITFNKKQDNKVSTVPLINKCTLIHQILPKPLLIVHQESKNTDNFLLIKHDKRREYDVGSTMTIKKCCLSIKYIEINHDDKIKTKYELHIILNYLLQFHTLQYFDKTHPLILAFNQIKLFKQKKNTFISYSTKHELYYQMIHNISHLNYHYSQITNILYLCFYCYFIYFRTFFVLLYYCVLFNEYQSLIKWIEDFSVKNKSKVFSKKKKKKQTNK
ncbi:hypothetical protein RFI_33024 [Reticulomyxa filosa]|uniref:Uncharacterized protein n=1 Tax=Reticulomyxa filosa TaxID=46433 RepID=X6LTG3_RETFI|nr:hypothetical protein RFI_33024 [Reticulomyxa filosa]|eukprot:ETO04372.1 hypothetical protein RFI_33024 [Reticulomyxa filosa]